MKRKMNEANNAEEKIGKASICLWTRVSTRTQPSAIKNYKKMNCANLHGASFFFQQISLPSVRKHEIDNLKKLIKNSEDTKCFLRKSKLILFPFHNK